MTVGGILKLGNQSGVRVCDSVSVTKAKSWDISELEGHGTDAVKNDAYLYQLIDAGWVEQDLNLEKDARQNHGAFHCWKKMVSTASLSLDNLAQWHLGSRQALITSPCKRPSPF
jgi:hypothetical protein